MKIVSQNHAAQLTRLDEIDSADRLMLDAIACDLRGLYGETVVDLPEEFLALAARLEAPRTDARAA